MMTLMNRIQFRPGLLMRGFMELFGTQVKCEAAVIGWRWARGYLCPSCDLVDAFFSSFRRRRLLFRRCSMALCRSVWNLTSHPVPCDARGQGRGRRERRHWQVCELAQAQIGDGDEVGCGPETARGALGLLHETVHGFDEGIAAVIQHAV